MSKSLDARAQSTGSTAVPTPPTDDVVLVSNRQPYRHRYENDSVTVDQPTGGLVAGLDPVMQRVSGTWVAWGDGDADRDATDADGTVAVPPDDPAYTLDRVWLSESDVEGYYYGYSNRALWPLCHTAMGRVAFDDEEWDTYRSVNRTFAEAVVERADAGTTVWFQDYHFALAPRRVSEASDALCMQFWHIPWPADDVFRVCPHRRQLLDGLLGNDLLSFHSPRYVRNFMDCVVDCLPDAAVDRVAGRVRYRGETTRLTSAPLGIDADDFADTSARATADDWRTVCDCLGVDPDRRVVLGVDRLDYTKGIPQRLDALERLWEDHPEWRGEFTYVQKGCESRSEIPAYRRLQSTIEERVDELNERFATDDWQPVAYTTDHLSREHLCALYRGSEVALVSPLRDGMNLVAQEYVASQVENDGVLVLSRMAGAHETLGDLALTVTPRDASACAGTIERALTMSAEERQRTMRRLRDCVHGADLDSWLDRQFRDASDVRRRRPA